MPTWATTCTGRTRLSLAAGRLGRPRRLRFELAYRKAVGHHTAAGIV